MSHELDPLPMALFADSGHMRIYTSKSTLKTIKVSSGVVNEEIEVTFISGCALLWVPGGPSGGNMQTYAYATQER